MRFIYIVFIFLISSLFSLAQNVTTTVIKAPAQLRCNDVPAKLNNIVFGAVPPNSQNQPVVVFVHGWFDNGYAWFMAKNKWYESAYNQGYRTAFFFHSFSDEYEKNGKVVAEMIRETCRHYNTDKVIAVCHSKGGYDMDYALYNENIWDSVQGVITMSTPYFGSPMCDLIANPILRLVLENIPIVGPIFKGKGTYQMQTAYMAGVVRPMIDNHPNNRPDKFRCFAAWGSEHKTVLPNNMPDDILKVVFKDYQPLCLDIPGFGVFVGDLMSAGMQITGGLSKLIQVQDRYNNPSKNQQYNDGLAPYYSSLRPGSTVISQPPPAQQSNLSHIDELFSWNMWNIVQPEIEYFKNNPVLRKQKAIAATQDVEPFQASSNIQLIQGNTLEINNATSNKLYITGNYQNGNIKIFDANNKLVKTIALNFSVESMYSIFHEIDFSDLPANKNYTLKSSVALIGLFQDGNAATIQLETPASKTYFSNEALGFEVALKDWQTDINTTTVKGFLNRNITENGEVVFDKIIPVTFVYDDKKQAFICNDKMDLENGIYNLSVYADANNIKRFATTSVLIKQSKEVVFNEENLLTIFPNPTSDLLKINFSVTENANYKIAIYDMVGKALLEKNLGHINAGAKEIELSTKSYNLPSGAYILSLIKNNERKSNKVFTVN